MWILILCSFLPYQKVHHNSLHLHEITHTHTPHRVLPWDYVNCPAHGHNNEVQSDLDFLDSLPKSISIHNTDDTRLMVLDEQTMANKLEGSKTHMPQGWEISPTEIWRLDITTLLRVRLSGGHEIMCWEHGLQSKR